MSATIQVKCGACGRTLVRLEGGALICPSCKAIPVSTGDASATACVIAVSIALAALVVYAIIFT